jgi:hypothetical protein
MPTTQTSTPSPIKRPKIEPKPKPAKPVKKYGTADKIHAARKPEEANAPPECVEKWQRKIKTQLFQNDHVDRQFKGIGNASRFFEDIDENMHLWYSKTVKTDSVPEAEDLIRRKAS